MLYGLTKPIKPEMGILRLGLVLFRTIDELVFCREGPCMKKNLFLLLLSIPTFVFSVTSQAQLVTNGTFDSDASGWSWENIDGSGGWRSSGGNPDGNFILNSNGSTTTDPTISQLVTGLTPSAQYTLSGDFASVYPSFGNPSATSFGIFADGTLIASYSRPGGDGVYGSFSVDISATDSDILLAFKGEMDGDDSSYRIDNISLILIDAPPPPVAANNTPVPVDSVWALIILTVSLMLFAGLALRREQ